MELKVGMYVRTMFGIGRIEEEQGIWRNPYTNKIETVFIIDNGARQTDIVFSNYIYQSDIIKSSNNIIDLIEVGDYVNGFKIIRVAEKCNLYPKTLKAIQNKQEDTFDIFNEDVKSILTHEQYEANCYKIGE